jgi:uncharacterized protein (TIGR03066 family)
MNSFRLFLLGCAVLGFICSSALAADEKKGSEPTNKEKIIGTWKPTKGEGSAVPDATLEFTKDGKLKVTVKIGDNTVTVEGSYEIDGDQITLTMKEGDKEKKETATIKTLTDKVLVTVDKKGKTEEFKKK